MALLKTAYVLLWFPVPSETFIFNEVINLSRLGLPIGVFTLYGELRRHLSDQMRSATVPVERLGVAHIKSVFTGIAYWLKRKPRLTLRLTHEVPFRRWNGLEKCGESLWAFLCAFHLARRFEEEGIEHIHAPWACGPATAAWVASRLTGIPFTFTGRAHDIYPPDGAIKEKIRDAVFVRAENKANVAQLNRYAGGISKRIIPTYNGVPMDAAGLSPVRMQAPYQIVAVGRFVLTKGFDLLIRAASVLKRKGLDFHLVLAGDGWLKPWLKCLAKWTGVSDRVRFPGFVTYDRMPELFMRADVLVMPSKVIFTGNRDGIPTVILEALLHRVPVIATDVCGISEIIEDGLTGLLIPEKNVDAIANAVLRMVHDREGALGMAERGRARILEEFNAEINHRRLLELYEQIPDRG